MTQPMEQLANDLSLWYSPPIGQGPAKSPILMVHGMWGWHWCWSHFVRTFAQAGYPCYAVDLIGHGAHTRQNPPQGNLKIEHYVSELKKTIAFITTKHDNNKPLVISYSMGGLIAQKTLETTPAAALVLISSAAPKGIFSPPPLRSLLILIKYIIMSFFTHLVMPNDKELCYLAFHQLQNEELQMALARVVPEYSCAYRQVILSRISIKSSDISCPVLVLGGKQDRMVTLNSNQKLAQKYNAPIKIFENASHWIIRDHNWQDVCNYILEWVEHNNNYKSL